MTNATRQAEWRKNHPTQSHTLDKERKRKARGFYERLHTRIEGAKQTKAKKKAEAVAQEQADVIMAEQAKQEYQALRAMTKKPSIEPEPWRFLSAAREKTMASDLASG